ncbi:hypothetical protein L6R53_16655 [Myxococcota bacterium]|nr:hypothetical protein [Myxococcota bacterium]
MVRPSPAPALPLLRLSWPVAWPRLARHALPGWLALTAALLFAHNVVDWEGLRRVLHAQAPGPLAGLAILAWTLATRRSLLPVLCARPLQALVRQPVSDLAWSAAWLPLLAVAALPVALVALLAGHPAQAPAWVLAGAVGVVAACPRGLRGLLGAAGAGGLAWLYGSLPAVAGGALALAVAALLVGPLWTQALRSADVVAARLPGRPRGPLDALVRLDLLATVRLAPSTLAGAYGGALLAVGWLAVAAGQGGLDAQGRALAGAILPTFACAGVLVAHAEALGHRPDLAHTHWPVSPQRRALALALAAFALCLPVLLALGAASHSVDGQARAGLVGIALAAAGALVGAWAPGRRAFNLGALLAAGALAAGVGAAPWPLPLADLPLAAALVALLARRLDQGRERAA